MKAAAVEVEKLRNVLLRFGCGGAAEPGRTYGGPADTCGAGYEFE
jgi:hypothetical protein